MNMKDFGGITCYREAKGQDAKCTSYEGREACNSGLVQAGVDVLQEDDYVFVPDPGIGVSSVNKQTMIARDTLEAKTTRLILFILMSAVAACTAFFESQGTSTNVNLINPVNLRVLDRQDLQMDQYLLCYCIYHAHNSNVSINNNWRMTMHSRINRDWLRLAQHNYRYDVVLYIYLFY